MNIRIGLRVAAAVVIGGWMLQAQALTLRPSTAGVIAGIGYGPSNCEPSCVETVFGVDDLELLYKAEAGIPVEEEGDFANAYRTSFNLSRSDATIRFTEGGAPIVCGGCYLAIKDGNHSPGYYFYNLSAWNGTETIYLRDFWPGRGAISHVSIWGSTVAVPEPGVLSLLGAGLLLLGLRRRKSALPV